ncbi:MAG: alpha/beta hydrolase [Gammaproteobacteria bacterium]|nr:alpha/beta hydrolase [Gammaproteobacteria bacterium]
MVSRETDLAAPLSADLLPDGIRSRFIDGINGLRMHFLEAGYESAARPCVLLLHGFPELAYSWRRVMPRLAAAGYHVVAPDQRGYGRTSGWDGDYDGDLASYRFLNLIRDALGLVWALGHRSVASVVGHDFGSPVAAWCALVRPDVFESVALMSAPFAGTPVLASGALAAASEGPTNGGQRTPLHEALAGLDPPRKHYQWYYSTREANEDMWHCPQGVHDFLRAYFHHKSADWKQNTPFPLASMSAQELAKLPTYYVMELDKGMAATVAEEMPSTEEIAACAWLPERDLAVYSAEYSRTGFQGGLQWYRCRTTRIDLTELQLFSGRTIDIPSVFIAGRRDWGIYQSRGAVETMQQSACTKMMNCHLVDGAGHWVQQEQPDEVSRLLIEFLEARNSGHG